METEIITILPIFDVLFRSIIQGHFFHAQARMKLHANGLISPNIPVGL